MGASGARRSRWRRKPSLVTGLSAAARSARLGKRHSAGPGKTEAIADQVKGYCRETVGSQAPGSKHGSKLRCSPVGTTEMPTTECWAPLGCDIGCSWNLTLSHSRCIQKHCHLACFLVSPDARHKILGHEPNNYSHFWSGNAPGVLQQMNE